MITYKKYFSVMMLVFYTSLSFGQDDKLYESKLFIQQSDTLQYRIMMPKNFDDSKQYPVLLFLHGAGERGNDNSSQLVHGSTLFASEENRNNFAAIVIFPQCPKNSYWANVTIDRSSYPLKLDFPEDKKPTKPMELVIKLMEDFAEKSYVNKNQIYVAGMSMGGMGTFEILSRKSTMFAASFIICGAGNPISTKKYAKSTPLWVFHGAKDTVIKAQESVKMVSAILENGGKPNFSLYAKDTHNSWDTAFAEPNLLPWLFSNIKN